MLPAWTFALAWTTLFKNRTVGGQAGWFESLGLTRRTGSPMAACR
jgi:iron(III) transport system permease protein